MPHIAGGPAAVAAANNETDRNEGYRTLVELLMALPPNKLVNLPLASGLKVTLNRFRDNLVSTAEAMVPPVKLCAKKNEDKTGLVVWREDCRATAGQSRRRSPERQGIGRGPNLFC